MIKKTKLLQGMQENNIHLTHFQLSLANPNEIYLSSQYTHLYKIPIQAQSDQFDIDPEKRVLVYTLKMQKLVDMKQVPNFRLLVLTTKKMVVIDLMTCQAIHQYSEIQLNQSTLTMISNFDIDLKPIIVAQGKPGCGFELRDMMDYGYTHSSGLKASQIQGMKLIGQIFLNESLHQLLSKFNTSELYYGEGITNLLASQGGQICFVSLKVR